MSSGEGRVVLLAPAWIGRVSGPRRQMLILLLLADKIKSLRGQMLTPGLSLLVRWQRGLGLELLGASIR